MSDRTILETIEDKIKSDFNLLNHFVKKEDMLNFSVKNEFYSFYALKDDFIIDIALFKLYCFCDYSIDDIYKLLIDLSKKYHKSNLSALSYSDFIQYTKKKHFVYRKKVYEKTSEDYQNKIHIKETAESESITHLVDDYNDTVDVIETLNSDMKYLCNDEDISAEKRMNYIDKYSKVSIRLNEKRSVLLEKIRAEKL